MKKSPLIVMLILLFILIFAQKVFAVCPVCAISIGACVGLSRYLKLDDLITGLWIGALVIASIAWTINWLNAKNIRFMFRKIIITLLYYASVLYPLYHYKFIGLFANKFCRVDKLLFGIIAGSIIGYGAILLENYLRAKNHNKAILRGQKIIIQVGILMIISIIFYFIAKGL